MDLFHLYPKIVNSCMLFSAKASLVRDALCANLVARLMKTGSVNPWKPLFIRCWNVRTFIYVGSQAPKMRSLYDYRMPVKVTKLWVWLLINEDALDASYCLHHSTFGDGSGQHWVALSLRHQAQNAFLSCPLVKSRMAVERLKGHPLNIRVLSVYTTTL